MSTPHPLQVLLVEDSREDVFFFKRALARSGVEVELHIAMDGQQAVHLLDPNGGTGLRPDVVFLDLKLPLLSGFDVLRWIRERNFNPPLHVIVLSGSPHEKDQALASELGASEYLVKPIGGEALKARLARFVPAH